MEVRLRLTRMRVAILVVIAAAVGAGVAYAAIPDGNGVYTACMLNKVGTIRIIDPAAQHCSASLESQITFNAKGQRGDPGTDGVSVSSLAEPKGANCANGGSKFTAVNGTSYACNGADGGTSHAYTADKRGSFSGFSSEQPRSVSVSLPAGSYILTGSIQTMHIQFPLNSQPYCQLRSSGGEFNAPVHMGYLSSETLTATTTLSAPGSAEVACYFDEPGNVASADVISILAVAVGGVN